MSVDAYGLVKWLHVLSALAVIGPLMALPLWASLARRAHRPPLVAYAARLIDRAMMRYVLPGLMLLVVTGLAMAVGPLAEWNAFSREGRWILLGMGLWVVLAPTLGFTAGALRQLRRLPEAEHERRARVGRHLRWSALLGLLLAIAVEGVMVLQPAWGPAP